MLWNFMVPGSASANVTISSPQLRCLAVDSLGNVTLTWVIPPNINASFLSYNIYSSPTKTGPYVESAIILSSAQNTATISGTSAKAAPVYFYIIDSTTNGKSVALDTMSTIFLTCTNLGTGIAFLTWNAIHVPLPPTSTGWYKVYREQPNHAWRLIDSTKGLSFNDTITISNPCSATLTYKVELADSSGCESVSNWPFSNFANILVPEVPVLDTVSVSSTGGVYISWSKSNSPDVKGYIIYKNINGHRTIIDTVYGINNLHFYDNSHSADSGSQSYWIAAIDSCNNTSPYCNVQSTIYLTQSPDSCLHNNTLSWTQFVDLIPEVGHYRVYRSVNGGPFSLLGITNPQTLSYIDNRLTAAGDYCYLIQVVDSNNLSITASSNILCYKVNVHPLPAFSYLQTASVANSTSIIVNAYVDTSTHTHQYLLQRAASIEGPFTDVGTINSSSPYISFGDVTANPNLQSYYYQVISQNLCGQNIDTTQIGETIYLTATGDGSGTNTLTWNDYINWLKGDSIYIIYRNEDSGAFSPIVSIPYTGAGENVFKDDITSILTGQGIFGYYVKAIEKHPPPYPFIDTSTSNISKAYQDPRMYIPNIFNPEGKNNIFKPVGVFLDVQNYDFSIFSRWGIEVFETHNTEDGWNGQYGGHYVPEGVYVYHITYTSSKGEYFERKGTITLLK